MSFWQIRRAKSRSISSVFAKTFFGNYGTGDPGRRNVGGDGGGDGGGNAGADGVDGMMVQEAVFPSLRSGDRHDEAGLQKTSENRLQTVFKQLQRNDSPTSRISTRY